MDGLTKFRLKNRGEWVNLYQIIQGYYKISVEGKDCNRFFQICSYHDIFLWQIRKENANWYTCFCCRRSLEQLYVIGNKTNIKIQVVDRAGIPFWLKYVRKQSWFIAGAIMALFLLVECSGRIWDIQIEGNRYYDADTLLRAIKKEQIYIGMPLKKVDYMNLAAYMRGQFDRITWASAEQTGCRVILHIKENLLKTEVSEPKEGESYDIIAKKDGIVHRILVRNGTAVAEPGMEIKKGDVLISGKMPIYNDNGDIVEEKPVHADGDVFILTNYAYYNEINRTWFENELVKEEKKCLLQIDKYRYEIPHISDLVRKNNRKYHDFIATVQSITPVCLTESFQVPVGIGTKKRFFYKKVPKTYSDLQLKKLSEGEFYYFCTNLEKKGVQIYENNVKMYMSDASCVMTGSISVIEETGSCIVSGTWSEERNVNGGVDE